MAATNLDEGIKEYHDYIGGHWPNAFDFKKKYGNTFRLVESVEAYKLLGLEGKGHFVKQYGMAVCYPGTDYTTIRWFNPGRNQPKMESPDKRHKPLHAFVPPNFPPEFKGTLYIAESAIKATAMCELGYHAISGSGVWGLYTNSGWPENMPLEVMGNCEKVIILFDYDITHNPHVRDAVTKLHFGLEHDYPGVRVFKKVLPNPEDLGLDGEAYKKYGFDDFWLAVGTESAITWMDLEDDGRGGLHPLDSTPLGRHIAELNAGYVAVGNPAVIVDRDTGSFIKKNDFIGLVEAPRRFRRGTKNTTLYSAADEWVKTEDRNYVKTARYSPGRDEWEPGVFYNKWRDDGVESIECDVTPALSMVENMVPDEEVRNLLVGLTAWIVQNPGLRCEKLAVLISHVQSTGKSTYVEMLEKVLGPTNCAAIDPSHFGERFNSHYVESRLVRMDEVNQFPEKAMGKLERYITDSRVDVEEKGIPVYYMDNTMNFMVTSNKPGAFRFKDNERRAFIVECTPTVHYPTGDVYWTDLRGWLDDVGFSGWRYYLENYPLLEFDVRFMPPMTAMKKHMQNTGNNEYTQFVNDLALTPWEVIPKTAREYYTGRELTHFLLGPMRIEAVGQQQMQEHVQKLAEALSTKYKQANAGRPIKISGKGDRYWCIFGPEDATNAMVNKNVSKTPSFTLEG